jgi:hypothetical protein
LWQNDIIFLPTAMTQGVTTSMKAPGRHSLMLAAGIQTLSNPWTPAGNMRGDRLGTFMETNLNPWLTTNKEAHHEKDDRFADGSGMDADGSDGECMGIFRASSDTSLGLDAAHSLPAGDYGDTFIGSHAGYSNTTGYYNSSIGADAGYSNTTWSWNTYHENPTCPPFQGGVGGTSIAGDERLSRS